MASNGNIEIKSGETTYVLNYGSNAACRLESEMPDRSYGDVLDELRGPNPRVSTIREFVKAALVSPAGLSLDQVGDVIDEIGGWALVLVGLESQSPYAANAKAALKALEKVLAAPAVTDHLAVPRKPRRKRAA